MYLRHHQLYNIQITSYFPFERMWPDGLLPLGVISVISQSTAVVTVWPLGPSWGHFCPFIHQNASPGCFNEQILSWG